MLKIRTLKQLVKLPVKPPQKIIFFSKCKLEVDGTPNLIFENVDTIIFDWCDRNFIDCWLTPKSFPNVERIYMNSWCGKEIHRFKNIMVYLPIRINDFGIVNGYWVKSPSIKIIDEDHFKVMDQLTSRIDINTE